MFEGINEMALLVATIVAIAVGNVWYSPLVFGKWGSVSNIVPRTDGVISKPSTLRTFILVALCNFGILYMLAHAVVWTTLLGISIVECALWLTLLVGSGIVLSSVFEKRTFVYALVNIGYAAVIIVGGMHVIAYWPW